MKIMVKIKEKDKWQEVEERGYVDEKELQEMLAASPDLIPVGELAGGRKSIKVAVREAGLPGSGSTDFIGIDEDGNITIVETKLAKNAEIKREVIGQILEYAAYLWQKTYEEFDEMVFKKANGHLFDLMQKEMKEDDEWSAEEFRKTVETNLQNGTFALFIIVDSINEELRHIVDYLKRTQETSLELYALELKYFQEKSGGSIVLPQLYGVANPQLRKRPKEPLKEWTKEAYIMFAEESIADKWAVKVIRELYDFAFENFDRTYIKPSRTVGRLRAMVSHLEAKDGFVPLFQVKNTNHIKIAFWGIKNQFPGSKGERYSKFLLDRLSGLPAIQEWYVATDKKIKNLSLEGKKWEGFIGSSMRIESAIPDEKALAAFKSAFLDFKKEMQRTLSN